MEEIEQLRIFLTVVRAGSFSAAGRRLELAPSSVSRQITTLEQHLQTRLFTRSTRSLALTDAGQLYADHVTRILADIEEARHAVRDLDTSPRGTLRITAPLAFGRSHVAPAVVGFLEANPHIEIELGLTDRVVDLVEEGVDLGIRIGSLPDSSLIARTLAPMHRAIYAAPRYLEQHGEPATPHALDDHNCLTFRLGEGGSLWRPGADIWRLQAPDGIAEIPVTGSLRASSADVLVQAACAGIGLILVVDWLVHDHVRTGRLVPVLTAFPVPGSGPDSGVHAVYPSGRYASTRLRAFVDFAITAFNSDTATGTK